jgi:hypothetical protein
MVGLSKVGFVGLLSLLGAVVEGDGIGSGITTVGDGANSGKIVLCGLPPGAGVVTLLGVVGTTSIVGDKVGMLTTGGLKMGPKLGDGALGAATGSVGVIVLFVVMVGLKKGRNDGRFVPVGEPSSSPQNNVKSA